MEVNTLDRWEAEAKEYLAHFVGEEESRILALIDLVREMAEALHNIQAESTEELTDPKLEGEYFRDYARAALKKFKEWK